MTTIKKISLVAAVLLAIVPTLLFAQAIPPVNGGTVIGADPVPVEVFERTDCVHCQALKAFLTELSDRRSDIVVTYHNIAEEEHYQHWLTVAELEDLPKVTPITLIGTTIIQGFATPETTGKYLEQLIDSRIGKENYTFDTFIAAGGTGEVSNVDDGTCDADSGVCGIGSSAVPLVVNVPFIGPVDLGGFSLPTMSLVLGFVDGFNPCAMWVLVTFLIILSQVGSRKKIWQFAGLFIVAEAIMYYLILNVWFTAWDFVGLDRIVTPIVGIVAIGGGIFFLYEWWKYEEACRIAGFDRRAKIQTKITQLVNSKFGWLTVIGIIGLALSVNVIEFACSIGIPQAFTKIIELNQLSFWSSQGYMLLYILMYMVDDLIVFGLAAYGINKISSTSKYTRWTNLLGGIIMVLLGLLLIFKRDWLVFG